MTKLPWFIKKRKHHNNKGRRRIKRGKTYEEVKAMAEKMGVKFGG